MPLERVRFLIERFRDVVTNQGENPPVPKPRAGSEQAAVTAFGHGRELGLQLLESMLLTRHLDRAAHELRATGDGHYTICSAGHEASVVLGRLTRPADPTMVHYRDGAFFIERARHVPDFDPVRAVLSSLVASANDPISGGRHKVFGSRALGIVPQTSTIASHLPRAVGLAFALDRRVRLGLSPPDDSIVVCAFGDASLNHSTALGALNATGWAAHQHHKLPILFVCEDNGLGISVRTPPGWVERQARSFPGIEPFFADGGSLDETYRVAGEAVHHCRVRRSAALLVIRCVRLLGHAGSDVDTSYRSRQELEHAVSQDPVVLHALGLMRAGVPARELLELERRAQARVDGESERLKLEPRLTDRRAIEAALVRRPSSDPKPATSSAQPTSERLTLAQGINRALTSILESRPEALLFGEDVGKKGGVYGVTKGLQERFGALRVFDTLLDEQTILGLALGTALSGLIPIPEIQYLAYLHNAEDQLRGEAMTLRFFSNGAYENPMLVRIAGLAYQKGFGGHFHNDNSLSVLRDIPGLVVVVPARADDALSLYRSALDLIEREGRVVVVVEPIALYHRRDGANEGDGNWLAADTGESAEFARGRLYPAENPEIALLTYGNGLSMAMAAVDRLRREQGLAISVLDLRFITPLPERDILELARIAGRVLVVDECRRSGNVSEAIVTLLADNAFTGPTARVTSADCFIPLGDAARHVLLSEEEITNAARELATRDRRK
jgi:2-oxoisovalerate dehydrogenase E1 component